jgi:hypothetical protein
MSIFLKKEISMEKKHPFSNPNINYVFALLNVGIVVTCLVFVVVLLVTGLIKGFHPSPESVLEAPLIVLSIGPAAITAKILIIIIGTAFPLALYYVHETADSNDLSYENSFMENVGLFISKFLSIAFLFMAYFGYDSFINENSNVLVGIIFIGISVSGSYIWAEVSEHSEC